jgi:dipeptidyl aminopeptidase/acylaminoacyl peptidase
VDLKTGEGRDLLEGFDRWPKRPIWSPDASAVFFTAAHDGHVRVFRADLDGTVTCLSGEGAFSDLCPSPDGQLLYALRSTISEPPHPVVFELGGTDAEPRRLRSFEELDQLALKARGLSGSPPRPRTGRRSRLGCSCRRGLRRRTLLP